MSTEPPQITDEQVQQVVIALAEWAVRKLADVVSAKLHPKAGA